MSRNPRMPTVVLDAQWRREVPFVLGACLIDLQRTIEARSLGLTAQHLPAGIRPLWREMCEQADAGHSDIDPVALRRVIGISEAHEAEAMRVLIRDYQTDAAGHRVGEHVTRLRELWLRLQLAAATKAQVAAIEANDEPGAEEYGRSLESAEEIRSELAKLKTPPRTWKDIVDSAHLLATDKSRVLHTGLLNF